MAALTALVTFLAGWSAASYVAALALLLTGRWRPRMGSRLANAGAVVFFAASRAFPSALALALAASALIALALVFLTRRSARSAGVLAAIPLLAMLLTVDRAFFDPQTASDFQSATIALLCTAGPAACAFAAATLLSQRKRANPKTFSR